MKGLLAATAVGSIAVAGLVGYGYVNRHKFYDQRFNGLHFQKNVCDSLEASVACNDRKPIYGLEHPLESVMLVLVEEGTHKLVMSLCRQNDGTHELALVGGTVKSQKRCEDYMTEYSDLRFITEERQFSPSECSDVVFENPRTCLAREVVKEITGTHELRQAELEQFDWLMQKIYQSPDWTFLQMDKTVRITEPNGHATTSIPVSTYMGLCRVMLSSSEISQLNSQIADYDKYDRREHSVFMAKQWAVKEFESNGKSRNRLDVESADNSSRKYSKDMVFIFSFWKEFSALIMKK